MSPHRIGYVAALALVPAASSFGAVKIDNSVQAQFRLVEVFGAYPNYTYASTANTATPITGLGATNRTRTFSLQYTLTNGSGATFPAGLTAVEVDILGTAGTYSKAQLTRSMVQTGGSALPLGSSDTSGVTTGSSSSGNPAFGLYRPFRGGLMNIGNSNDPVNGTVVPNGIAQFDAISITQTLSNADFASPGNFFGVYLFSVVVPDSFSGSFQIAGKFRFESGANAIHFDFFDDGFTQPVSSTNSVDAALTIFVVPVPTSCITLGVAAFAAPRSRRALRVR